MKPGGVRPLAPLELWGGVECTLVRIGEQYRDQLVDTGHRARLSDIDAMAALGIKAVRYPILWESVAPQSPHELDFSWHDERLERLRAHGIKVIAGLVHHGSGPRYASMLDAHFPRMLADYAERVARRYPWVALWTPINEPLTTARFSCLYGHWYPHQRSLEAMFRGLANECLGTALAMEAIRRVIPAAELLVTEDLGKTFATEPLAHQAQHENDRRWLSLDLLAGRVVDGHPFHRALRKAGVGEDTLLTLASGLGMPSMVGINHYLTSERFLDHRIGRYPGVAPGTNGVDTYVDVEAVRIARLGGEVGTGRRLREAWLRYGLPLAVTEVHHGCTREEQVRWLREVWTAVEQERKDGADIRAVTLWSMFGAVDWRSLLTRRDNVYDVGAFDTRSKIPRPTLVAKAAATLAKGEALDHPVFDLPGWWKRPGRCHGRPSYDTLPASAERARPILITGATGTLGRAYGRICAHRGLAFALTTRAELDITDEASIAAALLRFKPWAVINAAGFVRTWEAEQNADECLASNAIGPELLAKACKGAGIPLVTYSSDLVFDGKLGRPYVEDDVTAPACAYGHSKAEAESRLRAADADTLIIRTSAFFGPWDEFNFLTDTIARLQRGEDVVASDRTVVSPTYVPDLVHASLDLLLDGETGIWHLANDGAVSWHELAREAASMAKLGRSAVARIRPVDDAPHADTSLTSDRAILLRPLDQALRDFADHSPSCARL